MSRHTIWETTAPIYPEPPVILPFAMCNLAAKRGQRGIKERGMSENSTRHNRPSRGVGPDAPLRYKGGACEL
jgi:hypothetical protein